VRANEDCRSLAGLLDYLEMVYCNIGESTTELIGGATLLFLWLLYLMMLMSSTAEMYFVPPLTVLADHLKLSPVRILDPPGGVRTVMSPTLAACCHRRWRV
jgi:hypothetical protein